MAVAARRTAGMKNFILKGLFGNAKGDWKLMKRDELKDFEVEE
jgi:hypothetical protein